MLNLLAKLFGKVRAWVVCTAECQRLYKIIIVFVCILLILYYIDYLTINNLSLVVDCSPEAPSENVNNESNSLGNKDANTSQKKPFWFKWSPLQWGAAALGVQVCGGMIYNYLCEILGTESLIEWLIKFFFD